MIRTRGPSLVLIFGYLFLYAPILFLVIYSFNESVFPGVWTHFSLKWYESLFENHAVWSAFRNSIKIATISATGAVILGTMGALVLSRMPKFRGRTFFSLITSAPLVMPEIISGVSLLLMFVVLEQMFGKFICRGVATVTIAHITLTMAYVILIVQARLSDFDMTLEEAAMDLGARSLRAMTSIALPLIMPAIIAAWLLAFALSLDDVVIASFLTGAQATTLPILIFSSVKMGITPEMNALATLLIAGVSFIVLIIGLILYRKTSHPA